MPHRRSSLLKADRDNEIVAKRINAIKRLSLVALSNDEKLDAKLVALAKDKSDGRAVAHLHPIC